ncbi:hypothetical protein BT63DRAFT_413773 [Microthyrium microscopicum]|uniref:Uncharacterized protein n=1 Tax=Microthyrium microscopicum TaxID=703497 RepID=A0A6A6UCG9_9PEZI|nr:hypothetical protein BT63DRAFT_413773 [Microthyrium microscopicum]
MPVLSWIDYRNGVVSAWKGVDDHLQATLRAAGIPLNCTIWDRKDQLTFVYLIMHAARAYVPAIPEGSSQNWTRLGELANEAEEWMRKIEENGEVIWNAYETIRDLLGEEGYDEDEEAQEAVRQWVEDIRDALNDPHNGAREHWYRLGWVKYTA